MEQNLEKNTQILIANQNQEMFDIQRDIDLILQLLIQQISMKRQQVFQKIISQNKN